MSDSMKNTLSDSKSTSLSFWKITQSLPLGKKKRRPLRRRTVIYCDCGQPAVARIQVKVGPNGCYTVTLNLCSDCLALEEQKR